MTGSQEAPNSSYEGERKSDIQRQESRVQCFLLEARKTMTGHLCPSWLQYGLFDLAWVEILVCALEAPSWGGEGTETGCPQKYSQDLCLPPETWVPCGFVLPCSLHRTDLLWVIFHVLPS